MKYESAISIKCPMCGYTNVVGARVLIEHYHAHDGSPFIFLCDSEEGGCDRYFVTQINLVASVHTYKYEEVPHVPE